MISSPYVLLLIFWFELEKWPHLNLEWTHRREPRHWIIYSVNSHSWRVDPLRQRAKTSVPNLGPGQGYAKHIVPCRANSDYCRISKESTNPCFSIPDWRRSPLRLQDCVRQQRISCLCHIRSRFLAAVVCTADIVLKIHGVFWKSLQEMLFLKILI